MKAVKRLFAVGALVTASVVSAHAESVPLGLVLSGGGAKGAYEVGVWQELQAAGLASNVAVISGTSVGALNAALFATRPDAAEQIWREKMEDVFSINTNRVGESIQKTLNDASNAVEVAKTTGENWRGIVSFILNASLRAADNYVKTAESKDMIVGYVDSTKLANAIDEILPKVWSSEVPVVYATAVEKGGLTSKTWRLNSESYDRRSLMIRASAAFPRAFDTVSIDGKVYVDGGWEEKGGDNVPIAPILDNHLQVKTVIVVYLKDERHINPAQRDRVRSAAEKKGVRLVEIIPSEDIGGSFGGWEGVFDASPETARRLIELGRKDARKVLAEAGIGFGVGQPADSAKEDGGNV